MKISQLLGRPLRFMNLDDSPQQENSSDCGVYVCIQMRHLLLKRLLSANASEKVSMSMGGKLVDANGGRKEMVKLIDSFRKEGERRRSCVVSVHFAKLADIADMMNLEVPHTFDTAMTNLVLRHESTHRMSVVCPVQIEFQALDVRSQRPILCIHLAFKSNLVQPGLKAGSSDPPS